MKKLSRIISLGLLTLVGFVLVANIALAAEFEIPDVGLPYKKEAAKTLTESIFSWFFILAGALCIAIIIWAGISYAVAGGDEEKVTKAKTRLIYGIIGVAVIIAAYTITKVIFEALQEGKIDTPDI